MTEVEKKAFCNLYVAYFTLTGEIKNLIRYSNEIDDNYKITDISYNTSIILNKFLSVNTILYNTFAKELSEFYNEERFVKPFNTELFVFVLYLRNFIVHEGFYKIRVFPAVKVEVEKRNVSLKLFKINLAISDIQEFLKLEEVRKPGKRELINLSKNFIEKYQNNIDITEILIEYYDKMIEMYRIFEERLGEKIEYLKK